MRLERWGVMVDHQLDVHGEVEEGEEPRFIGYPTDEHPIDYLCLKEHDTPEPVWASDLEKKEVIENEV